MNMKPKMFITWAVLLSLAFLAQSCEKESESPENENSGQTSFNGGSSHNSGQNCMSCHTAGGQGEGNFTLAGTVYDAQGTSPFSNATIKLYSDASATGTPKYTLQADTKGNFFTTGAIDFGSGLYATVLSANGTSHMASPVTTGQCNSCHGVTTDRIRIN